MDAKQARQLAEKNRDPNSWDYPELELDSVSSKYPLERITGEAWDTIMQGVGLRAEAGRTTLVIEPFINIPGKVHPKPIEDEVCGMLMHRLNDQGFGSNPVDPTDDGWWERVDERVVFRIKW